MAKLSLIANPTFKAMVGIPIAGSEPVQVELIFKHRTKDDLNQFIKDRPGKSDEESFMDMVCGWELEDPFDTESVNKLLQNYSGTGLATFRVYLDELLQAKIKN